MWASFLDFVSEVAAIRQELHEESQGAVARAAEKARRYRVDQRVVSLGVVRGDWRFVEYLPDGTGEAEALRRADELRAKGNGEWEFRLMRIPDVEWEEVASS